MARLPIPGSDNKTWGSILNDYLKVAHDSGGHIKDDSIGDDQISDVSQTKVTGLSATLSNKANNSDVVHLTGNETIEGVKTFSTTVNVPSPSDDGNAATKLYVDSLVSASLVFDIREYGAVGDGTTDDLQAIQDTIDAVQNAGGGIVFVPKGTYIVSGSPQITESNIIVSGAGAGSKILLASASLNAAGTTIGIWVNGASDVLIRDICVDGNFENIAKNGTYQGSSTLWDPTIAQYGAQGPKTYIYAGSGVDASTYLTYRAPIRITNATNVTVQNCLIQNSVSAGILIDADSVDGTKNVLIRNNRVLLCWDNGIYFHKGVLNGTAIGNHCSDTQYSGITSIFCKNTSVVANICHDGGPSTSDSAGIEFCANIGGIIADNIVYDSLFDGIYLKNSNETGITGGDSNLYSRNKDIVISSNYIYDCNHPAFPGQTARGLSVRGSDNIQATGNKIEHCDYGLSISDAVGGIVAQNNLIHKNRSWGIQIGESIDLFNVQILNNTIQHNGANGVTASAPMIFKGNFVHHNEGHGVNTYTPPTGLPYKTDYIEDNIIADNLYNGVAAEGGSNSLAVIRNNEFYNSDSLTFYDGVSTTSSATFTSATASFASSDVGAVIVIMGVGSANGNDTLRTTISAVTNSTTVTLAASASIGRSSVTFSLLRPKQVFYDGVMTSGNPALTSATAKFTSNDDGKTVLIYNTDGPTPTLTGTYTVASYVSSTQVTLNASPTNRSDILFVIKRNLGRQERALYVNNNTQVNFTGNRSWSMRVENYNNSSITSSSVLQDNYDFGSNTTHEPVTPALITPLSSSGSGNSYLGPKDSTRLINAGGGVATVYMPDTAVTSRGQVFTIKKTDSSVNTVTIATTNNQTIDGELTQTLSAQWESLRLQNDGSNWVTI